MVQSSSNKPCRAKVVNVDCYDGQHTHPVILTDKPQDIRIWCPKAKRSFYAHLPKMEKWQ